MCFCSVRLWRWILSLFGLVLVDVLAVVVVVVVAVEDGAVCSLMTYMTWVS